MRPGPHNLFFVPVTGTALGHSHAGLHVHNTWNLSLISSRFVKMIVLTYNDKYRSLQQIPLLLIQLSFFPFSYCGFDLMTVDGNSNILVCFCFCSSV